MIFQHGTFYSKVPYEFVPKCRRKLCGQEHSRRKERFAWEAALLPRLAPIVALTSAHLALPISIKVPTIDSPMTCKDVSARAANVCSGCEEES